MGEKGTDDIFAATNPFWFPDGGPAEMSSVPFSETMAAYLFVNIEVKDQTAYAEYRKGVSPMIYKHGGEYLARGGAAELIEGDWTPSRVVLLKFPDMAALKAFLDDPEYQPLKDLRLRAADTQMLALEGI